MAESSGKKFEYEIRDVRDNRYLADMTVLMSGNPSNHPYRLYDEIEMPDEIIHQNNSRRFRICTIEKVVTQKTELLGDQKIKLYIMPTKKEFKPFVCLDWRNLSNGLDDIDRSGEDNWLHTD